MRADFYVPILSRLAECWSLQPYRFGLNVHELINDRNIFLGSFRLDEEVVGVSVAAETLKKWQFTVVALAWTRCKCAVHTPDILIFYIVATGILSWSETITQVWRSTTRFLFRIPTDIVLIFPVGYLDFNCRTWIWWQERLTFIWFFILILIELYLFFDNKVRRFTILVFRVISWNLGIILGLFDTTICLFIQFFYVPL